MQPIEANMPVVSVPPLDLTNVSAKDKFIQVDGNDLKLIDKPSSGFFGRIFSGKPANTGLEKVIGVVTDKIANRLWENDESRQTLNGDQLRIMQENLAYMKDKADKHNDRWFVKLFGSKINTAGLQVLMEITEEKKKMLELQAKVEELVYDMNYAGDDAFMPKFQYDGSVDGLFQRTAKGDDKKAVDDHFVALAGNVKAMVRENISENVRNEIADYLDAMDPDYGPIAGVDGEKERLTPEEAKRKLSPDAVRFLNAYLSLLKVIYEKDWSNRNNDPKQGVEAFLRAEPLNISLAGSRKQTTDSGKEPGKFQGNVDKIQNRYRRALIHLMYPDGVPAKPAA